MDRSRVSLQFLRKREKVEKAPSADDWLSLAARLSVVPTTTPSAARAVHWTLEAQTATHHTHTHTHTHSYVCIYTHAHTHKPWSLSPWPKVHAQPPLEACRGTWNRSSYHTLSLSHSHTHSYTVYVSEWVSESYAGETAGGETNFQVEEGPFAHSHVNTYSKLNAVRSWNIFFCIIY